MSPVELGRLLQLTGQLGFSSSSERYISRATWLWITLWECLGMSAPTECKLFSSWAFPVPQLWEIPTRASNFLSLLFNQIYQLWQADFQKKNSYCGNRKNVFSLLAASLLRPFDLFPRSIKYLRGTRVVTNQLCHCPLGGWRTFHKN